MAQFDPSIIVALVSIVVSVAALTYCGRSFFLPSATEAVSLKESVEAPSSKPAVASSKPKKNKKSSKDKASKAKATEESSQIKYDDSDDDDDDVPTKNSKSANKSEGKKSILKKSSAQPAAAAKPQAAPAPVPAASKPSEPRYEVAYDDDFDYSLLTSHVNEEWVEIKKTRSKKVAPTPEVVTKPTPVSAPVVETVVAPAAPSAPIDQVTDEFTIPAKKVGSVIGTKGAVKIQIQNLTGTEISFPNAPSKDAKDSNEPVLISITGPAEGVKKAKKAVQDLVSKGVAALLQGEDYRETQVSVHPMYLADIIGKKGDNIRAIQDALKIKIIVPPSTSSNSSTQNIKIGISGLKDGVIRGKALIKELMQYYHTSITHPGIVHEELDVSPQYYNHIIGSKGSEIKHIQANFKVSVHIPNINTVNQSLLVVGLPANVEKAKNYIMKIVDNIMNGRPKNGENRVKAPVEEEVVDDSNYEPESRPQMFIGDLLGASTSSPIEQPNLEETSWSSSVLGSSTTSAWGSVA